MQTVVLVLLLGRLLCGVRGSPEDSSPDVLSMVTKLQTQVETLEAKVQDLKSTPGGQSRQVAFYVGLQGENDSSNYGPVTAAGPMKYKRIVSNIGNGYNATTGIFTAPVKGMYVFHFTIFNTFKPSHNCRALLKKNNEVLAVALDEADSDTHDSSTNVAVVTMEVGDSVFVELQEGKQVFDAFGHYNSFSGFLLYPM